MTAREFFKKTRHRDVMTKPWTNEVFEFADAYGSYLNKQSERRIARLTKALEEQLKDARWMRQVEALLSPGKPLPICDFWSPRAFWKENNPRIK